MTVAQCNMSTEHCPNDADRGKQKYWEKILSQCHPVHLTTHTDGPELNPALRSERSATNHLSHDTALDLRFIQTMYNNSLYTSQRTRHLPCTKTSQLIQYARLNIGVYCGNCTRYTKQVVYIDTNVIQKYSISIIHTSSSSDTHVPRWTTVTK